MTHFKKRLLESTKTRQSEDSIIYRDVHLVQQSRYMCTIHQVLLLCKILYKSSISFEKHTSSSKLASFFVRVKATKVAYMNVDFCVILSRIKLSTCKLRLLGGQSIGPSRLIHRFFKMALNRDRTEFA